MYIGHLRAAHTLVDPAHHISQDALRIVFDFGVDLRRIPALATDGQRHRQDIQQLCRRPRREFALARRHVHLVIVQRMQRRRSGTRHPRGIGAGPRMRRLARQHVGHAIRHGPHALADLCAARKAGAQSSVDIVVLVSAQPGGGANLRFAQHDPGMHGGVQLVAGAVEKTGVDEDHAILHGTYAFHQIDTGAALLVHHADLQRMARQAQQVLDAVE